MQQTSRKLGKWSEKKALSGKKNWLFSCIWGLSKKQQDFEACPHHKCETVPGYKCETVPGYKWEAAHLYL